MDLRHISAYIFVAIMAIYFVAYVFSWPSGSYKNYRILNGERASYYEDEVDKKLPHYNPSLLFWNNFKFIIFKEGREGVLIGSDGWLFTTEEFSYPDNYHQNIEHNQSYILQTYLKLKEQGVDLHIFPIPAKSRIYNKYLGRYDLPGYRKNLYQNFLQFLYRNNINHSDPLSTFLHFSEDMFLKTDTHWTSEGAMKSARLVAANLNIRGRKAYKSQEVASNLHKGDLVSYTASNMFNEEKISTWSTILTDNDTVDIFGDQYFPIVLIGTSYSANKKWNFEGFLSEVLQSDMLNLSDEGLGPFVVMDNYLNNQFLSNLKPKIIIWEIPERYIPFYYELKNKT